MPASPVPLDSLIVKLKLHPSKLARFLPNDEADAHLAVGNGTATSHTLTFEKHASRYAASANGMDVRDTATTSQQAASRSTSEYNASLDVGTVDAYSQPKSLRPFEAKTERSQGEIAQDIRDFGLGESRYGRDKVDIPPAQKRKRQEG